jgi:XTP/dITP diphosphohydrolase
LEIFFATSNKNKFAEAAEALVAARITVRHFPFDHNEVRSESLEEIAREAVSAAYQICRRPVFVEDAGLFIYALDGFPGTYSGWVQKKIGIGGILKLMEGTEDRSAYFEACIAYHDGHAISTYHGRCDGYIAEKARGESGFAYDPIFVPEGHSQTFAENIELKSNLSHRYKSLLEFSKSLNPRR